MMLSEIDIKDWERTELQTKLYNISRKTVVSLAEDSNEPFWFDHIDGAYSYCQLLDGTVWHPAAWSEVFVWSKK